ncbi:MAG: hypothetical protein DI598_06660 [Pseudopedobacter saltans]|uniref:Lipoprotein n=1 Tax=Pseudopedobacter saltans TaxID=151895 RepID=A0A2W5H7Z9_9SPHI|nr:MAG: hypothetical protein DI598_06660 [Pseudopedobacter saltans]
MKNKLTFILIGLMAVLSIGFSCKKDTVEQQDSGGVYSYFLTMTSDKWVHDQPSNSYSYEIAIGSLFPRGYDYNVDWAFVFAGPKDSDGKISYTQLVYGGESLIDGYYFSYSTGSEAGSSRSIIITAKAVDNTITTAPSFNVYFNLIFLQPKDLGILNNSTKNDFEQLKKVLNIKTIPTN